ncbi:7-cyano-7-deazaguanine/7-aminomethyl-7-deazaguanine transporter [Gallaecimonas kandeliae]|uniref:7-cyano-7-deazaguanine/7-aminomethyl-7- deazaguanine transporter n=1 Tax=Gallaecimonas kandeliae TaxID=3029055 RepID=UPI0026477A5F|nr:7-cyano-7-deazaguanine/7-aminomethyl-7-deazaguanine transporter [Gallaecimonas kandeliae]WKE65443.1 7-cyano-7-deazaguanine/7-aminomethyl-7-deazaguanine transporter [Gallaecimonas kandeliae]
MSNSCFRRPLAWLVAFHILVITASNYLVQLPISLFGLHSTWGAFSFPFIFLATDLTVRLLGAAQARRVIFWVMIPALFVSYVVSVLFPQGDFGGFAQAGALNLFVARIALASFLAYVLGQVADVQIFTPLRSRGPWWLAPAVSTLLGNLLDTLVFFSAAFYHCGDPFMASHWLEIACLDYGFKLLISFAFFLPLYGVLLNGLLGLMGRRLAPA